MINFNDKSILDITAARCLGLIRSLFHETEFVNTDPQTLLETEYLPLYSQLQDLCFNKDGGIKWLFLNTIEEQSYLRDFREVDFYKTDVGFGFTVRGKVRFEVASKLEAAVPGQDNVFDMPTTLRLKSQNARISQIA